MHACRPQSKPKLSEMSSKRCTEIKHSNVLKFCCSRGTPQPLQSCSVFTMLDRSTTTSNRGLQVYLPLCRAISKQRTASSPLDTPPGTELYIAQLVGYVYLGIPCLQSSASITTGLPLQQSEPPLPVPSLGLPQPAPARATTLSQAAGALSPDLASREPRDLAVCTKFAQKAAIAALASGWPS